MNSADQTPRQQARTPASSIPLGQATRRGPLREGERVQIKDPKNRLHTIQLVAGGQFQTNRGILRHDDVIGKEDGQVVRTPEGREFQVLRPLLSDYVMSMPRGATIVYPKDAGPIIQYGDIFPGATVLEAGVGSGGLSLSLLDAVGVGGHLISVERREDFADIARANVELWFGAPHPAWDLRVGDMDAAALAEPRGSVDRIVLDMLAPWENLDAVIHALAPGGVLLCYVATVTQMSRLVEDMRQTGRFTEPQAWESMQRDWHLEGLAVRPEHRMVAHTGFLVRARRLADDVEALREARRPAPGAEGQGGMWDDEDGWTDQAVGARTSSDKKVRRVRRDVQAKADRWVHGVTVDGTAEGPEEQGEDSDG